MFSEIARYCYKVDDNPPDRYRSNASSRSACLQVGLDVIFFSKGLLLPLNLSGALRESRGPLQLPLTDLLDVDCVGTLHFRTCQYFPNHETGMGLTSAIRRVRRPAYMAARGVSWLTPSAPYA